MNTRIALYAAGMVVCATFGLFLASPHTVAGPPARAVDAGQSDRSITVRAQSPQTNAAAAQQQRGRTASAPLPSRPRASRSPIGRILQKIKPRVRLPNIFRAQGRQIPISRNRTTKQTAKARSANQRGSSSRRENSLVVHKRAQGTVSQQPQTEIQRQLQLLYQKNGRQMPSMDINSAAVSAQAARRVKTGNPFGRDLRRRTGGTPRKRLSLLERINPFRRWSSRTRRQPSSQLRRQPTSRTRRQPPARTLAQPQQRTERKPQSRRGFQPRPFPFGKDAALQAIRQQGDVNTATKPDANTDAVQQQPSGRVLVAPNKTNPRPVSIAQPIRREPRPFGLEPIEQNGPSRKSVINNRPVQSTAEIPVLINDGKKPVARNVSPRTQSVAQPQNRTGDDLSNAFPLRSEAEADKARQAKITPFSGLKLSNDPVPAKSPTTPKRRTTPAIVPKNAKTTVPGVSQLTTKDPTKPGRAVVAGKPISREKPHADKFRRIAARRGQRGFKGFCPVVLRDQRDLIDSQPTITAKYQGVTYHFSSATAKSAFESSPEKYAPVHSGRDVILLARDKRSIPGTLDHAVWFKDRLYLFSSAKTMKAFVLQPKRFAVTAVK
ncbi:MAG: hypothetical protein IID45_01375 [Planctomycetes bacterium]|nr:hypothetical protein [Planctomycetota bacterium]